MKEKIFDKLNPQQEAAVLHAEGSLRIIAGAGSGKTRVLTHKIAYLVSEIGIDPKKVLAVTFTNKAANEMKDRVKGLIGKEADKCQLSTYHSLAVRILRREIGFFNYPPNFNIIDTVDQKQILRPIYARYEASSRTLSFNLMIDYISKAKNNHMNGQEMFDKAHTDGEILQANIYKGYLESQKKSFSLDFDDLLIFVEKLFRESPSAKSRWEDKFDYVLVDEFQDTSKIQYEIVKVLAHHKNMTIVGDPDQTIYSWRGADINLILNFNKDFPMSKTITLEQNYRSTKNILKVANTLIKHNKERLDKKLFSENDEGDDVVFHHAYSPDAEARWIVTQINNLKKNKVQLKNIAIFYRANYLSKSIEQALIKEIIPYRIYGSIKFFQRQEIKDALAFLKVINNGDSVSLKRIINVPVRKLGVVAVEKINNFTDKKGLTLYEGIVNNINVLPIGKSQKIELAKLINLIRKYQQALKNNSISNVIDKFLIEIGYYASLEDFKDINREDNIKELINGIKIWENKTKEPNLDNYLQDIALFSSQDDVQLNKNFVSLMTVHTSKGLEYENVFVVGLSENIFPAARALEESKNGIEEERRLAYVAVTRAKNRLFLSDSKGYSIDHKFQKRPSRFLNEMGLNVRSFINEFIPPKDFKENYDDKKNLVAGDKVKHLFFGEGVVVRIAGSIAEVAFEAPHGIKSLIKTHKSLERVF